MCRAIRSMIDSSALAVGQFSFMRTRRRLLARSRMTSIPTVVGFKDIRLFCIHRHLPCRTPPLMKLLISEKASILWVFSYAQITDESPFFQVLVGSRQGCLKVERWLRLREGFEGDRKGPHRPTPLPPPLL